MRIPRAGDCDCPAPGDARPGALSGRWNHGVPQPSMTANLSPSATQSTSATASATGSATAATASWQERTSQLLAAYVRERSIDSRNAVVRANLPLIWQAARRESQRSGHSFEDLSQVGCLGLIKAVERFDLGRGASLSSAAMPWIIGAMRQHLRDRCQPLRASRTLHELTLRAHQLQQQRLQQQMPPPAPLRPGSPVVILVGRGHTIAEATTRAAASQFHRHGARAVYVSGDERATAFRLLQLGLPTGSVSGDSCARTTWENASLTSDWLRLNHPGAPVLLMTDPWQLPRASRAFLRLGLQVTPFSVEPNLSPRERNRLALRETAATLLYKVQGRL